MDVEESKRIDNLGHVATVSTVQNRINTAYDKLYYVRKDGKRVPYVCGICDEYLLTAATIDMLPIDTLKKHREYLTWQNIVPVNLRLPHVENTFTLCDTDEVLKDASWLEGMALSPRGLIRKKSTHHRGKPSIVCCTTCRTSLTGRTPATPLNAIVNANYVGCAPKCLTDLTDVELALLTPVKGYGYCFSFVGGAQRNLKGTMNFMRVEPRKICRAVIHLEQIGLTNHIVVLVTGKITTEQKKKVKEKAIIRTEFLIEAVTWLIKNNTRWKDVDLLEFREELNGRTPVVFDSSETVESLDSNVEKEELFTCYFPDKTTNDANGGFDDPSAFKEYVEKMQKKNFNVEMRLDLSKEFCRESDGDLLVNACLLQYPYGRCGMEDQRVLPNGSFTNKSDLREYLRHISLLSQRSFQQPMFQLIMYSLISKYRILTMSGMRLKGTQSARTLSQGFDSADLSATLKARERGDRNAGTNATKTLLQGVDASSRALPHTNEAAKSARSTGESMQHHLGIGSIWLTVTFDDENGLVLQIMSDNEIDDDTPTKDLSDDETAMRDKRRKKLRLDFPGLAAMNFEMLLDILCREVIGWDMATSSAIKIGLFGWCEGMSLAIEEQGRKTLHGHMTLWIRRFRELQKRLYFGTAVERHSAKQSITEYFDHIITTAFFPDSKFVPSTLYTFDHVCTVEKYVRRTPEVVGDQDLRILRHRLGFEVNGGKFAFCEHCEKTWTAEDLVIDFLDKKGGLETTTVRDDGTFWSSDLEVPKQRIRSKIVEFQKQIGAELEDTPVVAINAAYQHHLSFHRTSCHPCQKNKKKKKVHTCGSSCECRMRLPDRQRLKSEVAVLSDGKPWYAWTGEELMQPMVEFQPKRAKYDLFQNASCKAISQSKFACNSNCQLITDGPLSQYQFKYQHKGTQEQDTAEYANVDRAMKKMTDRVHDTDRKEALRLIRRAAFAHNQTNIISAPMSSYLLRHESRFYFSHDFTYCPVKDIQRLLNNQDVGGNIRYGADGQTYFENLALHYLCRPRELEDTSLREFTEGYTVTWINKETKRKHGDADRAIPFLHDTGYFKHPSAQKKGRNKGKAKQGVKENEDNKGYMKVSQWLFPDTRKFNANMFTCSEVEMNAEMERYAEILLVLFIPYRCLEDLKCIGLTTRFPYTMKVREMKRNDIRIMSCGGEAKTFTERNVEFLQNIQDTAHNSLRYKVKMDDLQRTTEPLFANEDDVRTNEDENVELAEEEGELDAYELLLDHLEDRDTMDNNPDFLARHMSGFTLRNVRNFGVHGCGYKMNLIPPSAASFTPGVVDAFVRHEATTSSRVTEQGSVVHENRTHYPVCDIVKILLRRTSARWDGDIFRNRAVDVETPNGSVRSILNWVDAAGLDHLQKRAFESIVASFVLTFYDVNENDTVDQMSRLEDHLKYRQAKRDLLRLKGGSNAGSQLVMLLHGPGGSGKSTVINLVIAYARGYCENLGHVFTARTIIICAMSGVAATLLHGDTAHRSLCLYREKIEEDEKDACNDTRLVIIDEISFASGDIFERVYSSTQKLMRNMWKDFGGLNIVFAGDYSQLEPCRAVAIYNAPVNSCYQGMVNAYIELDGTHRFRDDVEWGQRLLRFRQGIPTVEDIRTINRSCMLSETRLPPLGIQVATFRNSNRDAVNAAIFEDYCESNGDVSGQEVFNGAILVLMDNLAIVERDGAYVSVTSNKVKRYFWENCSEDKCKTGDKRSRCDSVLKLYPGCPMMHTANTDVARGQANGSRVRVQEVIVRTGETPIVFTLHSGVRVRAYMVGQIATIRVRHETPDIVPPTFDVGVEMYSFLATLQDDSFETKTKMSGRQFGIISNTATTGHKLQGCTVQSLLALEWEYKNNWAYVVLSRVTKMSGLFLFQELTEDLSKYAMPEKMTAMLAEFSEKHGLESIDAEIYDAMCNRYNDDVY